MKTVIPAIPADDETNRAHAARLGADPITCPPAPRSVPGRCDMCGGAIWLDPGTRDIRRILTADRNPPTIMCLLCAFHPTAPPPAPGQPKLGLERIKAALTRLRGHAG
jgi:hypothetical protein